MGNEKMWLIEEIKKMGNAGKGDGDWEKMWIYRVLIISYRSSNYRSCRHIYHLVLAISWHEDNFLTFSHYITCIPWVQK